MRSLFNAVVVLACLVGLVGGIHAQDEPRAIIDKAIKARGGEEKLARAKAWQSKVKGTMELPMLGATEFTGEAFVQMPDRSRYNIELKVQGQVVPVIACYDRKKAWRSLMGNAVDLEGADLNSLTDSLYAQQVSHLIVLKDKSYELTKLDEIKVEGKPAQGVKVVAKDRPEIKLYFDKESGLLVKLDRKVLDRQTGNEVQSESYPSDYKDVEGIKYAMKTRLLRGGKQIEETQVLELKLVDKHPDALFMKP